MRRIVLVLLVVAGAGCTRRGRPSWHGCNVSVSPDGTTYAFASTTAAVLVAGKQRIEVPFEKGSCLERGRDIGATGLVAVLHDGWRAIFLGERSDGGLGDPHPQFDTTVACVVDFRARTARPIRDLVPETLDLGHQLRHRSLFVGRHSGRLYTWTGSGTITIHDPARGVAELAGFDLASTSGCTVAESATHAVIACARYGEGGRSVTLDSVELSAWPPIASAGALATPAAVDGVALAADASRVAWFRNGERGAALRVHDVADPGRAPLDLPHGEGRVTAVTMTSDRILVGSTISERRDRGIVRVFTSDGRQLAALEVGDRIDGLAIVNGRIFVDLGCDLVWRDLP